MTAFMDNIASSVFRRRRTVIPQRSPFTGSVQVASMQDWQWVGSFTYAAMNEATASPLLAAIAGQGEGTGTFIAYDPNRPLPILQSEKFALVKGAGQTGTTLITDSWGASNTVLNAADYLYVYTASISAWQMFRMQTGWASDGAGEIAFLLDAPLRASPADNAAIQNTPDGGAAGITARITGYEIPKVGPDGFYQGITIEFEEVL